MVVRRPGLPPALVRTTPSSVARRAKSGTRDEPTLRRTPRLGGLSCDQFKPSCAGTFFQCLEPSARRDRVFGPHLNLAKGKRGFELDSNQTHGARLRHCPLSNFLGAQEILSCGHDIRMIKRHQDSHGHILALVRESNRFGNGCACLVHLS
jgi:hypothetical protein